MTQNPSGEITASNGLARRIGCVTMQKQHSMQNGEIFAEMKTPCLRT